MGEAAAYHVPACQSTGGKQLHCASYFDFIISPSFISTHEFYCFPVPSHLIVEGVNAQLWAAMLPAVLNHNTTVYQEKAFSVYHNLAKTTVPD